MLRRRPAITKTSGQGGPAFGTQEGSNGVAQGSQGLWCIATPDLRTVFAKALITCIVGDVLDGPVAAAAGLDLGQRDPVATKAGDEILNGDSGFAAAVPRDAAARLTTCAMPGKGR